MPDSTTMRFGRVPGVPLPVSRLVQGTAMIGSALNEDDSFALLDRVYELGCRAFDTAHVYAGGESERVLGRWAQQRGVRDQVVIISKGAHPRGEQKRVNPADITADLTESLERLQTDYIDLYLLHRDDPALPVEPIIDVLDEHWRAGRVRAFGASNWTTGRIEAANAYARSHDRQPFAASSAQLSLAEQLEAPWADSLSIGSPANAGERGWYAREQMPVFAWSSLAGGFFSGRYSRDNVDALDTDQDRLVRRAYASEANFERLERARRLGQERGLQPFQVALAYVLSQPLNLFALVGSFEGAMFEADLPALDVRLTPQELAWLDLRSESRDS